MSLDTGVQVSGLVLSEKAGSGDVMHRLGGDNQPFGLQQHNGDATQVGSVRQGAHRRGVGKLWYVHYRSSVLRGRPDARVVV